MIKAKIFNIPYNQNIFKEKSLSEEAVQFIKDDTTRKELEDILRDFIISNNL